MQQLNDMGETMQHANAKFERVQPREMRDIPFAFQANSLPTLPEALGWIVLGGSFLALCAAFLGVA